MDFSLSHVITDVIIIMCPRLCKVLVGVGLLEGMLGRLSYTAYGQEGVRIVAAVLRCCLLGQNDLTKGASISTGRIVKILS